MADQVCIYGKDRVLADIRAEVLRKYGLTACVDCDPELSVRGAPDGQVAVLCNSLGTEEQIDLARRLQGNSSERKIVILLPLGGSKPYPIDFAKIIEPDPVSLVAAVSELIKGA